MTYYVHLIITLHTPQCSTVYVVKELTGVVSHQKQVFRERNSGWMTNKAKAGS